MYDVQHGGDPALHTIPAVLLWRGALWTIIETGYGEQPRQFATRNPSVPQTTYAESVTRFVWWSRRFS